MKNRHVAYAHYITDILIFLSDLIDGLLLWAGNQVHLNLKQVCHVFFCFSLEHREHTLLLLWVRQDRSCSRKPKEIRAAAQTLCLQEKMMVS